MSFRLEELNNESKGTTDSAQDLATRILYEEQIQNPNLVRNILQKTKFFHRLMDFPQDTRKNQTVFFFLDSKSWSWNNQILLYCFIAKNFNEHPLGAEMESWQTISCRMSQNAADLCEQLRLILEPTKCTRLRGDYRTGRRINMRKIIPYIASQFRRDKIWLRRTKPAKRDYRITIAIDDSKSMHHNNSKLLTLEAVSLIAQALALLESGQLSVLSFGERVQILHHHSEQFDGVKLMQQLMFSQDKTKISQLLDFVRVQTVEEGHLSADNGLFENLLLILSDGRNIFSEGATKVSTRTNIKKNNLQTSNIILWFANLRSIFLFR